MELADLDLTMDGPDCASPDFFPELFASIDSSVSSGGDGDGGLACDG
jgi:hypothetical protein